MKKPTIFQLLYLKNRSVISNTVASLFLETLNKRSALQNRTTKFLSLTMLVFGIFLFCPNHLWSQNLKPFGKNYDANIKGDILVIGNNVLNRDFGTSGNRANDSYNDIGSSSVYNEATDMKWINIDPDGTKNFNSSSATLAIPAASQSCYKIAYAALYWSGTYSIAATNGSASGADRSKINKVRFKVGSSPYVDLAGTVIYDYVGVTGTTTGPLVPATAQGARNPYACMIDVTNYVRTGGETTYTVANIASSEGGNGTSAGHSAGWSLFIAYEDPKLPGKYITTHDGFSRIRGGDPSFTFPIDGFRTIPTGPVKAKLAFATLEGDKRDARDFMDIKGVLPGSINERITTPAIRPIVGGVPNTFNSSITNEDSYFTNRVPSSRNTLGYDTGVLTLSNPANATIKNGENKADITLGTGSDWYYLFFTALSIDIIEPEIVLTKRVLDKNGSDIGGQNVTFNDVLNYVIRFQNVGNDDAQNFTIEDTLPINVIFNYPTDIANLPAGVTVKSYDPTTRLLVFSIDNSLVQKNDPYQEFRIKVQIVSGCNALSNACSNIIDNVAIAKYTGTIDPDSGTVLSINSNDLCLAEPKATNFLVGIDGCIYQTDITICGDTVVLTAGSGYNKYEWSTSPFDASGNATGPILATTQSFTANNIGTYYVRNTAIAPCRSITQQFNVTRFGGVVSNPIVPFADETIICPNDGKQLPNIYLCGLNDFRLLKTGITNTSSIIWQKLTGGCAQVPNPTCASEATSCTWTQVATGPDFTATDPGEYRMILNYTGGCFNRFYFNVYKNTLNPTAVVTDIFCTKPGTLTVTNPPLSSSYEYSLSPTGPFVANNVFSITAPGIYTAYVRQVGVSQNPCIFTVPNLQVVQRQIDVQEIIQQPLCKGSLGNIIFNVTNVRAQYYLKVYKGAALVADFGPQNNNQFTVNNLAVGDYTYTITTDDACTKSGSFTIKEPDLLTATVNITKPLTCEDGELLVTPTGGTGPYVFFVNGSTSFQSTLTPFAISRPLPAGGLFAIRVVDANNCEYRIPSITINDNPKPEYTVTSTNIKCFGTSTGSINFTVTNPNGYAIAYSIDNGTTYVPNGNFTNLAPGTYTPVLKYTLSGVACLDPQTAIVITQPTALTATIAATDIGCSASGTIPAVVTITASGGTGTLQYSFNGNPFTTFNTFSIAVAGPVSAIVKDANDCITSALSVTIDAPEQFTAINITDFGWDCRTSPAGGHVNIAATGVSAPQRYSIISGPAGFDATENSDGEFKSLAPGAYVFQVRDTKTNCTLTRAYTVNGTPDIIAGGSVTTPILCFGGNGSIQFTVSGLNGHRYDYVVTNSAGTSIDSKNNQSAPTINLTNLPATGYTIEVKDRTTDCTAIYTINLTQPTAALRFTTSIPTNVNCNNDVSQITVTATGGTPNYTYAYRVAGSTATLTYAPGNVLNIDTTNGTVLTWDVYVKDANGCPSNSTVTVSSDALPTVTASLSGQCTSTTGNFTLTATGTGLAPLTYGISGPTGAFQTGNTFTVTASATPYTIWVKDRNGCTASATALLVYPQLTANAAVTKTLDCSTSPDAVITTTITGGKAPYTYTVQKGSGTPVSGGPASAVPTITTSVTNANADTYTFVITDANGCQTTTSTTVSAITNPTVAATPTMVSCNGGTNGSVILAGSGGSGGYTYSNNATSGFTSTPTFSGLAASATPYTFYVKDSKGCIGSIDVTITEPTALAATVTEVPFTCSPSNTKVAGTITINATVGTGTSPYKYSFNGGAFGTNNVFTVNDNGSDQSYTYSVQDANSCTISGSGTLLRLNPPTIATIGYTPIYCAPPSSTTSTVTVSVTAGTGVGTLTYTITSPAAATTNTTGATNGIFTGLTAGTYVFRVTDANACYYSESVTIAPVIPIAVSATKLSDVACFNGTTGSARFTVSNSSGGAGSYTVVTSPVIPAAQIAIVGDVYTISGLANGTYTFSVTDNTTNCPASAQVIITQPASALALSLVSNKNANCNVATARVEILAAGGTPNYRYSFVTSATTPGTYGNSPIANLDPLVSTTWYAHVIDAKGCTFILPITITTDPIPTVTASGSGCLGQVGGYTITATNTTPVAGIVTPITYSLNGGAFQGGDTFTITASGDYTVRMKDGNGCIVTAAITVVPQLTLTAVLNKDITCVVGDEPARITVTPSGGSGSFTYAITTPASEASNVTGASTGIFTTSVPGNYTFTVTDNATGCIYTTTTAIAVTAKVDPLITGITIPIGKEIKCNGDDTAAIAIAIDNTKGQSPFVFNVLNTTTGFNYGTQTSGLSAGDYLVTVTDAKGCTDTETITINEPAPITFVRTVTPITCNSLTGISLGSITINSVSGGTPNYTYHVTGVNGYDKKFTNQTGSTAVFEVVDFGLYQIIITDANGCTAFENDIIVTSPPSDLDISVVPVGPTCAGLGSAEVAIGTASSITGTGPFYFAVYSPGLTFVTGPPAVLPWYAEDAVGSKKTTIPNLIPGVTYTFIVYDANATHGGTGSGCYYYETSTIAIPTNSTITVNPLKPNNITCKGAADGNVTFTMNHTYGVATPVTYQIYNSQSVTPVGSAVSTTIPASGSLVISNFGTLPFGNYFVLVTETGAAPHAGCSISSAPFDITESAIDLSLTAQKIKKVNCNEDGVLAAFASNGTGPYTYQYLLDTVTAPVATTSGWVPNTTFATSITGNYVVYVKDNYGCIKSFPVILDADAAPTVTPPVAPICYDGTAFTITFSGTVDPAISGLPTYSVNGSAFQSTPSFTFNAADTYNLVIKDGNGCPADVDFVVLPQLQLSPLLTKELDCNLPTPNATVTVTASGGAGAGSYTYTISGPSNTTGAITGIFTGLDVGTYTFTVNDGACSATTTFTIDPLVPIVTIYTPLQPLCNGGTGSIELAATGGKAPYTFSFNGSIFTNTTVYPVPAGTYPYIVKDALGCEVTSSAVVGEPTILGVPTIAVTPLTCGTGNLPNGATITVTASGGTGVYEYSFDNGASYSSSYSITNAIAGTYEIIVKDTNGCQTAMQSIVVAPLDPPTDMDFSGTPVLCSVGNATSSVTVTVPVTGNGIAPFTFAMLTAPPVGFSQVANVFSGLPPGTYLFQVTDANGCTYQESYTVAPVTNIAVALTGVSDVTCNETPALNNGSATFKVTDFTRYTAVLTTGTGGTITQAADIVTLTGLAPDTYTLQVTDATTGCTADVSFAIAQPTVLDLALVSNVNANCNSGALVTVQGTGGTPSYTYAFVADGVMPIATDYTASNNATLAVTLPSPTNYDVWVQDANGCKFKLDVAVAIDATPTMAAPVAQCFVGAPISIDLSTLATVPMGPVQYYTVNGSNQVSTTYTITAPGVYTFSVTDAKGCTSNVVTYTIEKQLLANAVVTKDLYCAAPVNATIDVTITDGVAPYSYQMLLNGTPSGALVTGVAGPIFTAPVPAAGMYSFVITDSNAASCTVTTNVVEVTTPINPTATFVQTNITCIGATDGTISITPSGGIAPYTFTLTGTGANPSGAVSGNYTGLPNGTYNFVVTDAKGCTFNDNVTISLPAPLTANPVITPFTCSTTNAPQDAIVTLFPAGGTPGYTYSFDNGATYQASASFSVNTAQTITYVVRDANGCEVTGTEAVLPYTPPTDMDLSATPIYCSTIPAVTTITVNSVVGGVGPFVYEIISPITIAPIAPTAVPFSFANLAVGIYVIKVTDATGCSTSKAIEIVEEDKISVTAQILSNVQCFGSNEGSVAFTVANNITANNYTTTFSSILGVKTQVGDVITYTGLPAGTYTFTVDDRTSGCQAITSVTISEPSAPILPIINTTAITCVPGNDGSITATATGGWPGGYEFELVNGAITVQPFGPNATWNGLAAGTYTVKVRDTKGCEATTSVSLATPTLIDFTATPSTTLLSCKGDTNASITVNLPVTGGQGSKYLYTLNTTSATPMISSGPQASNVFANLGAGTYTVTVTDGWGCSSTSTAPIVITEPSEIVASLAIATTQTCAPLSASLTLTASGGTGIYEYSATTTGPWSSMGGTTITLPVAPGTYRYYVRDFPNGCVSQVSNDIQIDPLPPLQVKLDVINAKINCRGDLTGVIVATATGGLGNYVYTLVDGAGNPVAFTPVQTTPGNFTQLPAGTYRVRVNSGIDCQALSVSELIEEPSTAITANATVTPVTCNGAANGIITVTASGGTGIIKYAIAPRMDQFFDTGLFTNLAPGSYDIIVQDQNGCYILLNETITEPQPIFVSTVAGSEVQEVCTGDLNAAFDINITGGVAPYSVSLDTINGTYVPGTATQTVFTFAGLAGGAHTVYIKDANGCTATWEVLLEESVTLDPKAVVAYGCDNNAPSNTVTVTLDASITNPAEVDYALDGSTVFQASAIFKNVAPGFHTITARHTNGCEKITASFEVLGFTPLALTLADGGLNEIVATATGGAGNYNYSFDGGRTFTTNNKLIYFKSGDYTVIVRDANGCEATAMRYFEFIDIEIPNVFTPNGDGNNDTWTPINTINYKDLTINIFDRYGRKVASLREGQGWDGKYNSLELPTGDYWYVLKLKNVQDDREFVGHFTLMR